MDSTGHGLGATGLDIYLRYKVILYNFLENKLPNSPMLLTLFRPICYCMTLCQNKLRSAKETWLVNRQRRWRKWRPILLSFIIRATYSLGKWYLPYFCSLYGDLQKVVTCIANKIVTAVCRIFFFQQNYLLNHWLMLVLWSIIHIRLSFINICLCLVEWAQKTQI